MIKVGDRVCIAEGHYWPKSKYATVVRVTNIYSGAKRLRVTGRWYVVVHDGDRPNDLMLHLHKYVTKI